MQHMRRHLCHSMCCTFSDMCVMQLDHIYQQVKERLTWCHPSVWLPADLWLRCVIGCDTVRRCLKVWLFIPRPPWTLQWCHCITAAAGPKRCCDGGMNHSALNFNSIKTGKSPSVSDEILPNLMGNCRICTFYVVRIWCLSLSFWCSFYVCVEKMKQAAGRFRTAGLRQDETKTQDQEYWRRRKSVLVPDVWNAAVLPKLLTGFGFFDICSLRQRVIFIVIIFIIIFKVRHTDA